MTWPAAIRTFHHRRKGIRASAIATAAEADVSLFTLGVLSWSDLRAVAFHSLISLNG